MKRKGNFKALLLTTVMAVTLAAGTASAATTLKLSKTATTMKVGKSTTIKATASSKVTWSVADDSIATIKVSASTKSVKVTGVAAGTTKITAKVGSKKVTATVNVKGNKTTTAAETTSNAAWDLISEFIDKQGGKVVIQSGELSKNTSLNLGYDTKFKWYEKTGNGYVRYRELGTKLTDYQALARIYVDQYFRFRYGSGLVSAPDGTVYFDANNNGTFDAFDYPVEKWTQNTAKYKNAEGKYDFDNPAQVEGSATPDFKDYFLANGVLDLTWQKANMSEWNTFFDYAKQNVYGPEAYNVNVKYELTKEDGCIVAKRIVDTVITRRSIDWSKTNPISGDDYASYVNFKTFEMYETTDETVDTRTIKVLPLDQKAAIATINVVETYKDNKNTACNYTGTFNAVTNFNTPYITADSNVVWDFATSITGHKLRYYADKCPYVVDPYDKKGRDTLTLGGNKYSVYTWTDGPLVLYVNNNILGSLAYDYVTGDYRKVSAVEALATLNYILKDNGTNLSLKDLGFEKYVAERQDLDIRRFASDAAIDVNAYNAWEITVPGFAAFANSKYNDVQWKKDHNI